MWSTNAPRNIELRGRTKKERAPAGGRGSLVPALRGGANYGVGWPPKPTFLYVTPPTAALALAVQLRLVLKVRRALTVTWSPLCGVRWVVSAFWPKLTATSVSVLVN